MDRDDIAVWLGSELPVETKLRKHYESFRKPVSAEGFLELIRKSGTEDQKEGDPFCNVNSFSALPDVTEAEFFEEEPFSERFWEDPTQEVSIRRHLRFSPPKAHTHEFIEMAYVYRGKCTQTFFHPGKPEETVELGEGTLCILPPGLLHEIAVFDDSSVVNILIRADIMRQTLPSLVAGNHTLYDFFIRTLYEGEQSTYLLFDTEGSGGIGDLILDMMVELCEQKDYSQKIIHLMLGLLFTYLQREYSDTIRFSRYAAAGISYIPRILDYMREHERDVTVEEIASYFGMSRSYLSRIWKTHTGTTLSEALLSARMDRSCDYLENTNLSVQQIAEEVGYGDVTAFIRLFKKVYGVTPLQYRKNHIS